MDNELFWKHLKPVHPQAAAFCQKLAGDKETGNDLYQDGLLLALKKFDSLKDLSAFKGWLFRILINRYRNHCRSPWWKRRVDLDHDTFESSHTTDPCQRLDWQRQLSQVLAVLTPEDRALVVLYEIEGWSISELANMSTKPENTIKTRLRRARGKMRHLLERRKPGLDTKETRQDNKKTKEVISEVTYALQRCKTTDK